MFNARLFFTIFCACLLLNDKDAIAESSPDNRACTAQKEPLRRVAPAHQTDGEMTCLQTCGQEARSNVYADCIAEGGNRQACGQTGREWYRNCLETRCDESAIRLDNCRTDCRINAKEEMLLCQSNSDDVSACRDKKHTLVRDCIAECR